MNIPNENYVSNVVNTYSPKPCLVVNSYYTTKQGNRQGISAKLENLDSGLLQRFKSKEFLIR